LNLIYFDLHVFPDSRKRARKDPLPVETSLCLNSIMLL
jgi:hypothetical protein